MDIKGIVFVITFVITFTIVFTVIGTFLGVFDTSQDNQPITSQDNQSIPSQSKPRVVRNVAKSDTLPTIMAIPAQFNGQNTSLFYKLHRPGMVKITVEDKVVLEKFEPAGKHVYSWFGAYTRGVYYEAKLYVDGKQVDSCTMYRKPPVAIATPNGVVYKDY